MILESQKINLKNNFQIKNIEDEISLLKYLDPLLQFVLHHI